jgi:ABC-type multidrug transport system ATPase subunit
MNTLSATEVTKSFGSKSILDAISIQCATGEVVGLFGRNGCGKSTLLKILFGTASADSISLAINGKMVEPAKVIPQQIIGYLHQEPFLPKGAKVRDVIPMFFNDGAKQDKVFYAPGIAKVTDTKVGKLSMGQLRYLELLLIGNLDHPFLLLDEPFSMVEPLYKEHIKKFLTQLKTQKGIIITDHYYNDVLSVSNRNLLLQDVKILTISNQSELAAHGYLPG